MDFPSNVELLVEWLLYEEEVHDVLDVPDLPDFDVPSGTPQALDGLEFASGRFGSVSRRFGVTHGTVERNERIEGYDGNAPYQEVLQQDRVSGASDAVEQYFRELFSSIDLRSSPEPGTPNPVAVNRYVCGDTDVDPYDEWRDVRGDDVAVGVSLDMSGSMAKYELLAKTAVGAFCDGVQTFDGEVVANAWLTGRPGGKHGAESLLITGPNESFQWRHLDAVEPSSRDPIAGGMLACADLLEETSASTKVLLVIHDGKPSVCVRDDVSGKAEREAKQTVDELRDDGIAVVGVGFGKVNTRNLRKMFANNEADHDGYVHTEISNLAPALAGVLEQELESGGGVVA